MLYTDFRHFSCDVTLPGYALSSRLPFLVFYRHQKLCVTLPRACIYPGLQIVESVTTTCSHWTFSSYRKLLRALFLTPPSLAAAAAVLYMSFVVFAFFRQIVLNWKPSSPLKISRSTSRCLVQAQTLLGWQSHAPKQMAVRTHQRLPRPLVNREWATVKHNHTLYGL